MFGGSGGSNSFNDLYKFDLRQQKWHKLEPNGDLPDINFMRPKKGSVMIDTGVEVELPFSGKKPDLGAIELGGK